MISKRRLDNMSAPQFSVVLITPRYCRFTDGLIGSKSHTVANFYTQEFAIHACNKMAGEDPCEDYYYEVRKGGEKVYPKPTPLITPAYITDMNDDDIPF
jgi:hypothetical protein